MDEDDVEAMLDTCEAKDNHLTSWERSFIDGCQELISNHPLSEHRMEKLVEIYNKVKDLA